MNTRVVKVCQKQNFKLILQNQNKYSHHFSLATNLYFHIKQPYPTVKKVQLG